MFADASRPALAALLAVAAMAGGCAVTPDSCGAASPIYYAGTCHSEQALGPKMPCANGRVTVLRETATTWSACCQADRDNKTHCLEFARAEGQVGEYWICPPSKDFRRTPCASGG